MLIPNADTGREFQLLCLLLLFEREGISGEAHYLTKLLIIFFIRPDVPENWPYSRVASVNGQPPQFTKSTTPLGITLSDCSRGFSMRECKTMARQKPWNDHNNKPSSMGESAPLTWWNALSTFQKLKRGARLWNPTAASAGTVTVESRALGVKLHIRWLLAARWLRHAVGIVWIYWAVSKSPKHLVDELSLMWTVSLQKGSKCPVLISLYAWWRWTT